MFHFKGLTWFNRLIAIRFMEVNNYLPSGVRVLSSENGKREPDIVTNAAEVAEDQGFSVSADEIWKLKDENKLDELFRIMFIEQCRKLNDVLPELFSNSRDDYTELLLPISFIDDDAFIRHLVTDIDEADFNLEKQGQVEIIGWLYQYYNSEKKDAVFAAMQDKVKVSKENIAAATQLFTPDWIVRYMVENSLGRLWADGHADTSAKSEWKYYLEEAEQTPEVQAQLAEIREGRKQLTPEQIRFIDPCMGSGHILVYAFDVFMQIYLSCGYTERDAAQKIVKNNLWGLDLDKRAYQLAYFAVMMKARQYDRRFLTREIKPNLSHFQDLPPVLSGKKYEEKDSKSKKNNSKKENNADEKKVIHANPYINKFILQFENADTYGSLITVQADDEIDKALDDFQGTLDLTFGHMEHLMQLYKILSQRYDVVCTNPPYMAMSNANSTLKDYVEKKYPDSKNDFYAVFIEKCGELTTQSGYYAMITQHSWMFLSSYRRLREKLFLHTTINMAHLGARAFDEIAGEVVQTTAFVNVNRRIKNYNGVYNRLVDGMNEQEKSDFYLSGNYRYISTSEYFSSIPESPIAYWVSKNMFMAFSNRKLGDSFDLSNCIQPGDSELFLRFWYEISKSEIPDKWKFTSKGGSFRKWYGNIEYTLPYGNNGEILLRHPKTTLRTPDKYFQHGFVWSRITTGAISVRDWTEEKIVTDAGPVMYCNDYFYLGLLNSVVTEKMLFIISPTINYQVGNLSNIPVIKPKSEEVIENIRFLVEENVALCKTDWDSFETSWDFKKHPLI